MTTDRTQTWLLIARVNGGSPIRKQEALQARGSVNLAIASWKLQGYTKFWLYGPAPTPGGDRPMIFTPERPES